LNHAEQDNRNSSQDETIPRVPTPETDDDDDDAED
jgi:hypothetical protein